MKIAFFDTRSYDRRFFDEANKNHGHEIHYFEPSLKASTARLAEGCLAVCSFVNDRLDQQTLGILRQQGCQLILLRCAGYNHVDLSSAHSLGLKVTRVPEYSPHAVAEHTLALILCLNRKIHRAYQRVRELNFSLDGLVGFDLNAKKVGVIGTGKIGACFAKIAASLASEVFVCDPVPEPELSSYKNLKYVGLDELLSQSDIVSLHVPLTPKTKHLIDGKSIQKMKTGVMLVNTSRGALIETKALIDALKTQKIGSAALDVYEEEEGVFFHDLSSAMLNDDVLARLLTFPNVLITSHQAFLTEEALTAIAETTLTSASDFENQRPLSSLVEV